MEELKGHSIPDTKVVLVKANVCKLLEPKLIACGFTLLNQGRAIPFPSTGQQNKFRELIGAVLQLQLAQDEKVEEIMVRYRGTLQTLAK